MAGNSERGKQESDIVRERKEGGSKGEKAGKEECQEEKIENEHGKIRKSRKTGRGKE